jgi:hypothetical protein
MPVVTRGALGVGPERLRVHRLGIDLDRARATHTNSGPGIFRDEPEAPEHLGAGAELGAVNDDDRLWLARDHSRGPGLRTIGRCRLTRRRAWWPHLAFARRSIRARGSGDAPSGGYAFATRASELAEAHAVQYLASLSYDPLTAGGLELIGGSPLALNVAERAALRDNGFVISPRQEFPTFAYGYESIYAADLPVYISADMLLEALHRSYDEILKYLEQTLLRQDLTDLLVSMRARLASGTVPLAPNVQADVDIYLTVAESLLADADRAPLDPAQDIQVKKLVQSLRAAVGNVDLTLFGLPRQVDTSQFSPRGHHAGQPELESYFRAMMWLGRTDLRLLQTLGDGVTGLPPATAAARVRTRSAAGRASAGPLAAARSHGRSLRWRARRYDVAGARRTARRARGGERERAFAAAGEPRGRGDCERRVRRTAHREPHHGARCRQRHLPPGLDVRVLWTALHGG